MSSNKNLYELNLMTITDQLISHGIQTARSKISGKPGQRRNKVGLLKPGISDSGTCHG